MNEQTFDRDAEGRADELAARELESALADHRAGIDRRVTTHKPCRKCGGIDWRIAEGYAICEECMLDMSGAAS